MNRDPVFVPRVVRRIAGATTLRELRQERRVRLRLYAHPPTQILPRPKGSHAPHD